MSDENSYEALPPNFSLAANMAAGAFAGIAVGNIHDITINNILRRLGTFRNVPYRLIEGKNPN
jgi:uncharacterized PurR-regulated membrane protein YhhQ (DUF165 family)